MSDLSAAEWDMLTTLYTRGGHIPLAGPLSADHFVVMRLAERGLVHRLGRRGIWLTKDGQEAIEARIASS